MKKVLIGALSVGLCLSSAVYANQQDTSYALGAWIAGHFKQQGMTLDSQAYAKGFVAGYTGKNLKMSQGKIKSLVEVFQRQQSKALVARIKKQAKKNAKNSQAFLKKIKAKPGVKSLPGGVLYQIDKAGSGKKPTTSSTVVVEYTGKTADGKVFDASSKHGGTVSFSLANVIPAWKIALTHMKEGATWTIYAPPKTAYGAMGRPGVIAPNSVLIFNIHLVKVK